MWIQSQNTFFRGLEFELRDSHLQSRYYCLTYISSPFCSSYLETILPISASQGARITDMSLWYPAPCNILKQV
jgi:hypothetical protein